jgi:hypothetical protein
MSSDPAGIVRAERPGPAGGTDTARGLDNLVRATAKGLLATSLG